MNYFDDDKMDLMLESVINFLKEYSYKDILEIVAAAIDLNQSKK